MWNKMKMKVYTNCCLIDCDRSFDDDDDNEDEGDEVDDDADDDDDDDGDYYGTM